MLGFGGGDKILRGEQMPLNASLGSTSHVRNIALQHCIVKTHTGCYHQLP